VSECQNGLGIALKIDGLEVERIKWLHVKLTMD